MSVKFLKLLGVALAVPVTMLGNAGAFELTPKPTTSEARAAKKSSGILFRAKYKAVEFGLHQFSVPVHEALAQMAHDCEPTLQECRDLDLDNASSGILAGVRWNDDPPFQFSAGSGRYRECPQGRVPPPTISFALSVECWLAHFRDISKSARANPELFTNGQGTLLARSHFGDLQFLHAMATRKGEDPEVTKSRVLMWLEFTWRVQSRRNDYLKASMSTSDVPIQGFSEHFPKTEDRSIELLFTVGRPWFRHRIDDIAFGSFMHVVQDSFSGGHARREGELVAGCPVAPIAVFHSYAGQDDSEHKLRDSIDAAQSKAVIVDVLKELTKRRNARQDWHEIRPYLADCVFRLAPGAGPATTDVSS